MIDFNLPPVVGVFDKFDIGEDEIKAIEKSGIEKVMDVLNDDNVIRPDSKSNLSRASSMIIPREVQEQVKDTVLNIDKTVENIEESVKGEIEQP